MDFLAQLGLQTKEFWQKLDKKIKWLAIILSASIFVTLVGLTVINGKERFSPLFYDLDPKDAGQIMARLDEDKIPYQLEKGGKTILVPADKVDSLRISLTASGTLTGGVVGNEIFDQTKWGITDFEQKQRYKRALEGELIRSIRTLEEVKDARVHIVIPDPSPFIDEDKLATASVVLTLNPYAKFNAEQVKGIANFIAGAVPGLTPANVTIMDSAWNILSDPLLFQSLGLGQTTEPSGQLELKRTIERDLELRLQTMLERIFGFGKAIVRVSSDLGFDYKETKAERYEPVTGSKGIVRSEQQTKESQTGTSQQAPIGVAGITSNIPGYMINNNLEDSSSYDRSDSIINYEINKILEHHVSAPGNISRLSIAVWLNGDLDETTKEKVRDAVVAASGLDFARGDNLTVESLPFAVSEESEPISLPSKTEDLTQMAYYAAIILAVLILLIVYLRQRAKKKAEDRAILEMAAVAEEEPKFSTLVPLEEGGKAILEREAKLLARQKPEEVAKVIQSWLAEE